MPRWKGKKIAHKHYFDLKWAAEFRKYREERERIYVSRSAYDALRAFIKMQEDN